MTNEIYKFSVVKKVNKLCVEQIRIETSDEQKNEALYFIWKVKAGSIYESFLDYLKLHKEFNTDDFFKDNNLPKNTQETSKIISGLGFKGLVKEAFFDGTTDYIKFRDFVTTDDLNDKGISQDSFVNELSLLHSQQLVRLFPSKDYEMYPDLQQILREFPAWRRLKKDPMLRTKKRYFEMLGELLNRFGSDKE